MFASWHFLVPEYRCVLLCSEVDLCHFCLLWKLIVFGLETLSFARTNELRLLSQQKELRIRCSDNHWQFVVVFYQENRPDQIIFCCRFDTKFRLALKWFFLSACSLLFLSPSNEQSGFILSQQLVHFFDQRLLRLNQLILCWEGYWHCLVSNWSFWNYLFLSLNFNILMYLKYYSKLISEPTLLLNLLMWI